MKIAITGAGGFLGTELLRQLADRENILVYAFTFDFERERDTFVTADNIVTVDNSEVGSFDFSDIDVLISCAFPRNVNDETFAKGLDFVKTVVEKAVDDVVGSVINISSQSVYSQKREKPADESFAPVLETKYAVGKYWSELYINSLCRKIRHTNLRMASIIGAGFNQRLTNKFALKIKAGEQLTISGGDQLFGFLDVRDAASGIIKIALSKNDWQEVYNFGTNNAYKLRELAETAVETGCELGFKTNAPVVMPSDDWQNSSLIADEFMKDFNWKPQYSLKDTMKSIFDAIN